MDRILVSCYITFTQQIIIFGHYFVTLTKRIVDFVPLEHINIIGSL